MPLTYTSSLQHVVLESPHVCPVGYAVYRTPLVPFFALIQVAIKELTSLQTNSFTCLMGPTHTL